MRFYEVWDEAEKGRDLEEERGIDGMIYKGINIRHIGDTFGDYEMLRMDLGY